MEAHFTPALNGVRPFFEIGVIRAGVDGAGVKGPAGIIKADKVFGSGFPLIYANQILKIKINYKTHYSTLLNTKEAKTKEEKETEQEIDHQFAELMKVAKTKQRSGITEEISYYK